MGTLEFDFNKAMRQASELESLAEQLNRMAQNDYADNMQRLSGAWQGDSASKFLNKGAILQQDMVETARKLRYTANSYRKIARSVKEAEERAKRLAEIRMAKVQK